MKFIIIIIIVIFSIGFSTDLESAEPLGDFLCIAFVVCPCVKHVHVDLFSLLVCAFLHAETCAVHVCFVDESLLFLQHLELHNFLYQTIQPDLVVLDRQSQYCYRQANMAGYYILHNRKMRAFNIHKLCQKMYIFQIICWLQVISNHIICWLQVISNHIICWCRWISNHIICWLQVDKQPYCMLVAGDKQPYYMLVAGG